MKVEPRIRVTMKSHANAEPSPNCALGFQVLGGVPEEWVKPNFAQSEFCVVHSPEMPTQTAKTATPTTTASQLIAQRISETNGRISQISHAPTRDLAR